MATRYELQFTCYACNKTDATCEDNPPWYSDPVIPPPAGWDVSIKDDQQLCPECVHAEASWEILRLNSENKRLQDQLEGTASEDRLRRILDNFGSFLGDWDEWESHFNQLPVYTRSVLMHIYGQHEGTPDIPYEYCILCELFRTERYRNE